MNVWDVFQQSRINKAYAMAGQLSMKPDTAKDSIDSAVQRVDDRVEHLALLCQAMFELLQERTDLTGNDLAKKMEEIDLRDGKADGKITPEIRKCSQCGRTVSPKFGRCLYCGNQEAPSSPFAKV